MRLYTLFFLLTCSVCSAQNASIVGRIVDEEENPIPFANILLHTSLDSAFIKGTTTSADGTFEIIASPGNYRINISILGYKNKTIEVDVADRGIDLGTLIISIDTQLLQEVQVVGEKAQVEFQVDKRIYNVSKDLANAGGSAADLLDNIPAVNVNPEGGVSLRGSENVRIFINGKPSSLTMRDPNALRQMQSSMVERVEIITNPSARYEASGDAGIINIILKKEKQDGFNGVFNLSTGYPQLFGGSSRLNFRKQNVNLFVSYGADYREATGYRNSFQRFGSDSSDRRNTNLQRSEVSQNLIGGLDYDFSESASLNASFMYSVEDELNNSQINYQTFRDQLLSGTSVRTDKENEDEKNKEASLSFEKKFKRQDHHLTAEAQYINSIDAESSDYTQQWEQMSLIQRGKNISMEENVLLQSDYVHPFDDHNRFEAGFRSTYRLVDNEYALEDYIDNTWVSKDEFNNHLKYDEAVHGAYFLTAHKIKKFSIQAGIRTEYTDILTQLLRTDVSISKSYLNWFPSVSMGYALSEDKVLQFSYSKRISRPRFRDLLPFSNFSDTRVFFMGNPNLNPEYSHSFETGYLLNWKSGTFLPGLYYRYRTGVIQRLTTIDSLNISRIIPVNLATEQTYGVELNFSNTFNDWWQVNVNAVGFRARVEGQYEDDELSSDTYSFSTRTTSKMTIKRQFNFQAAFIYQAPRVTTQGRDLSSYSVDLSLARDILNGNGTLTFNVRDLFNTRIRRSIVDIENFYSESEFQGRPRQIRLTFTYRLNNAKIEEEREGGDEEE